MFVFSTLSLIQEVGFDIVSMGSPRSWLVIVVIFLLAVFLVGRVALKKMRRRHSE